MKIDVEIAGHKSVSYSYSIQIDLKDLLEVADNIQTPKDLQNYISELAYESDEEPEDYYEKVHGGDSWVELKVDEKLFNDFKALVNETHSKGLQSD